MLEILNNEDVKILKQGSIDLLVESYSNSSRILQIRGMTKEQAISADIVTSSDRSLVTTTIDITDTPICLTARTSTTGVKRGELYVKISLRVEGIVVALLTAGYVTDTSSVAYPNGKIESSIDGPGLIRSITGTDPAAGAEILETVPVGARWRLINVRFALTTDATVITRTLDLRLDDGATVFYGMGGGSTQAAGLTQIFNFTEIGPIRSVSANEVNASIPANGRMLAGYRIQTLTGNIQAGDNYGAPQILVEEWISP